jgi:hypothetical protein
LYCAQLIRITAVKKDYDFLNLLRKTQKVNPTVNTGIASNKRSRDCLFSEYGTSQVKYKIAATETEYIPKRMNFPKVVSRDLNIKMPIAMNSPNTIIVG